MAATRAVGESHQLPAHACVREDSREYLIELDVSAFRSRLTVRGDQQETPADEGKPFRLHERFEESFRDATAC